MKTAAVVIDDYKLDTFKQVLDEGGFEYTEHPGVTAGTLILRVKYDFVAKLKPWIEKANNKARKLR